MSQMTRDDFMDFFRDDEKLNTLSNDDRIEIFRTILAGSSDITVNLLREILDDYNRNDIKINYLLGITTLKRSDDLERYC
jgi:hypothetical protein